MSDEFDDQIQWDTEEEAAEVLGAVTGDEELAEEEPAELPPPPARAVPARKPGWLHRLGNAVTGRLARIDLPHWDLRNFAYGLAGIIALVLILRNWVDVRLDFVLWRFDIPKSLVIVAAIVLGAGLVRLGQLYWQRQPAQPDQPEDQ